MSEPRDFNDPIYKAWRKKVYARDRWKCRMPGCPGTDKRLNAHHIKCWSSHPSLRFVVSNGVTLCRTCHERIHGQERDYEPLFIRLLGRSPSDVMLRLLMKRYDRQTDSGR